MDAVELINRYTNAKLTADTMEAAINVLAFYDSDDLTGDDMAVAVRVLATIEMEQRKRMVDTAAHLDVVE